MFKKAARNIEYKKRLLIEELKRGMDRKIRRRLMETKCSPKSIKQWYERATKLNRYCRKS